MRFPNTVPAKFIEFADQDRGKTPIPDLRADKWVSFDTFEVQATERRILP